MPAIIKPFKLTPTFVVQPFRGQHVMVVTAYGGFDLKDPRKLTTEPVFLETSTGALPPGVAHDLARAKPNGEILIAGEAQAPNGNPVHGMPVSVSVGPIRRDMIVYGDRYWFEPEGEGVSVFSKPEPFTTMPLVDGRAFGGPKHPVNPAGKGFLAAEILKQAGRAPLPNIEDANAQIRHIGDKPLPMMVGVLDHEPSAQLAPVGAVLTGHVHELTSGVQNQYLSPGHGGSP